jgi:hypothetical protein
MDPGGGHAASRLRAAAWAGLIGVVVGSWAVRFAGHGTGTPLDTLTYFWPVYAATAERLAHGVVPSWNPYQLAGIPWVATLQGGVFHPVHLLYVVLPIHVAFMASNVLHLLLLAVATAIFVRRVGLGAPAAFVAAVVVTLRGTVPTLQFAPNQLEAYAWLPVGAIACLGLVHGPGARPAVLLAVATAMSLLAGYPQPTTYVVYTWATLLVALAVDARLGPRDAGRAALWFALAIGLGALLAGAQMLPAAELARLGVRAPHDLVERTMFPATATLSPALIPLRFGAIVGHPFSFGFAALALAATALAAPRRRVIAGWALGVAVLTALIALGDLTPAFAIYRALPGLLWFRNPARIVCITEFGVAIAAAFGIDALVGSRDRIGTRGATAVAAVAAAGLAWLASAGWAPADQWSAVAARATVVLVAVAAAALGSLPARTAATLALVGLVLFETSTARRVDLRLPYAASDIERIRTHDAPLRRLAAAAGHDRVWRYGAPSILQPEHMLKLATLYRFRAINDYEPLNLERQAAFFTYFTEGSTRPDRPPWLFPGTIVTLDPPPGVPPPATRRRLIDLLATRFLVTVPGQLVGDKGLNDFVRDAGYVDANTMGPFKLLENPRALPRAYVTYRVRAAPARPDDLLREISRPTFDPLAESYVEGTPPPSAADAPPGHPAVFVHDGESEVELEVTMARPGLVVLADTFYPGWRATVDGRPAPIVATNHLFRGVRADAGTHRVRFVYAPASVRAGAAASALGVVVSAGLLWRSRRVTARSPSRAAARPSRA